MALKMSASEENGGLIDEEAGNFCPFITTITTAPEQLLTTQDGRFRDAILPEKHLFFSKSLCFFVFNCCI
ncbi:hypothetical protein [Endozoicomonas sp. SCSIO W0465]|uniref:hypothetical protein n=1 Tax=Endozoicomonas sp. SCSIO W0465 TaxID=2918516 RepID=UPI002075BD7E|nr:hypothetical protein [Endozoicomonas sp. SCSIO W0465]USE37086.1 hypothetical protein MJO57_02315 [Endozoicomonas sp. SCSIO W0465]